VVRKRPKDQRKRYFRIPLGQKGEISGSPRGLISRRKRPDKERPEDKRRQGFQDTLRTYS